MENPTFLRARPVVLLTGAALLALSGCGEDGSFDLDLRESLGAPFDTSQAVERRVAPRPQPDTRGVISYPTYQVALAQRGDTVGDVAARVGLPAAEIARFNGLPPDVRLRGGEVVALPSRVAEPSPATGGTPAAGLSRPGAVTTTALEERAASAIDRAGPGGGPEPIRHQVARGETAFSIARRYDVPVEALAEWNGLGSNLGVREGQYLIIPLAAEAPAQAPSSAPGAGSVAPVPPSAETPLPEEDATRDAPEATPASPDMGAEATRSSASDARLAYPVSGSIIRTFSKGTNDGIDIAAEAGAPVRAADGGTVAAITRDTDQVPILVLRHSGNLLTVYAGVDQIALEKGDQVSRGDVIARVRNAIPSILHFEVREGFESVDPVDYLQ